MAEYSIEPWGEERQDIRIGKLACDMANVMRGTKTHTFKIDKFVLSFDPKANRPHQTVEEMQTVLNQMAAANRRKRGGMSGG